VVNPCDKFIKEKVVEGAIELVMMKNQLKSFKNYSSLYMDKARTKDKMPFFKDLINIFKGLQGQTY
jgi:hypothetical protein